MSFYVRDKRILFSLFFFRTVVTPSRLTSSLYILRNKNNKKNLIEWLLPYYMSYIVKILDIFDFFLFIDISFFFRSLLFEREKKLPMNRRFIIKNKDIEKISVHWLIDFVLLYDESLVYNVVHQHRQLSMCVCKFIQYSQCFQQLYSYTA